MSGGRVCAPGDLVPLPLLGDDAADYWQIIVLPRPDLGPFHVRLACGHTETVDEVRSITLLCYACRQRRMLNGYRMLGATSPGRPW